MGRARQAHRISIRGIANQLLGLAPASEFQVQTDGAAKQAVKPNLIAQCE